MERSIRKRRDKLDRYNKYIKQYKYLASIGDKKMGKVKVKANKLREKWMNIDDMTIIPEEEEPPDEPTDGQPGTSISPGHRSA